ncbi:MAG: AbrB family transcriptional regulator [bacterium]
MTYTTNLTQKGQVTIPIQIRKFLGLKPREKITFTKIKDKVTIAPAKDFLSLMGSVKSPLKYTDEEADKKVLSYIKKDYEK